MAAILHQLEAESSASAENGLQRLKAPELPINGLTEQAKCEDLETIIVGDDPEKFFQIGAQLPPLEKEEVIEFLRRNIDVFAQNAYEAPGVDPSFFYHHLNINPSVTPKKQPHRRSSKDHSDVVRDKVINLKQARAIKEVFYSEWLANTMLVKKKNGKWRMCVDFTNLNKACLKDPFPMPIAQDRLTGGRDCRPSSDDLLRRLLGIPPDITSLG